MQIKEITIESIKELKEKHPEYFGKKFTGRGNKEYISLHEILPSAFRGQDKLDQKTIDSIIEKLLKMSSDENYNRFRDGNKFNWIYTFNEFQHDKEYSPSLDLSKDIHMAFRFACSERDSFNNPIIKNDQDNKSKNINEDYVQLLLLEIDDDDFKLDTYNKLKANNMKEGLRKLMNGDFGKRILIDKGIYGDENFIPRNIIAQDSGLLLANHEQFKSLNFISIKIPKDKRKNILKELNDMNITEYSTFPDQRSVLHRCDKLFLSDVVLDDKIKKYCLKINELHKNKHNEQKSNNYKPIITLDDYKYNKMIGNFKNISNEISSTLFSDSYNLNNHFDVFLNSCRACGLSYNIGDWKSVKLYTEIINYMTDRNIINHKLIFDGDLDNNNFYAKIVSYGGEFYYREAKYQKLKNEIDDTELFLKYIDILKIYKKANEIKSANNNNLEFKSIDIGVAILTCEATLIHPKQTKITEEMTYYIINVMLSVFGDFETWNKKSIKTCDLVRGALSVGCDHCSISKLQKITDDIEKERQKTI